MKAVLSFIILLISSVTVYSDTVDFWHISYNNKVIARLNSVSDPFTLRISTSKVKSGDRLIVRFKDDTPCDPCIPIVVVIDEKRNKLGQVRGSGAWKPFNFTIHDLIGMANRSTTKSLGFYYLEEEGKTTSRMTLLFQVKFN